MTDQSQVVAQMVSMGLPPLPPNHPILDGKYKRFGPQKKAWYILREMTLKSGRVVITGAFGFFQGDNRNTVPVTVDYEAMSDEERGELARKQKEYETKEAEAKQKAVALAANRARSQWSKAGHEVDQHPYLVRKRVTAENVRVDKDGVLLVPMMRYSLSGSSMAGLQKIDALGEKNYNFGMDKIGAACLLGSLPGAPVIGLGEGYATCRSARMASVLANLANDLPVVVAFDAGNILNVAMGLRRDFPDVHLLFLADDDYRVVQRFIERLREEFKVSAAVPIDGVSHQVVADDGELVEVMAAWRMDAQDVPYIEADIRKGRLIRQYKYENAGVSKCKAAAKKVGNASVVIPSFANRGENKWTDFNDLHVEESLETVSSQIAFAIHAAQQPELVPAEPVVEPSASPDAGPLPTDSIPAAQQPVIASPAPSAAAPAASALPDAATAPLSDESPAPPGAEQPVSGSSSYSAADFPPEGFDMQFDYAPPPPAAQAVSGDLAPEGQGGGGKALKEKPKKVYGADHWDQVNYVLKNFILVYGEDMVWDEGQYMLMKISSMRTIVQNNDVMKFWGGEARKWVLKKNIVFDPKETPSPAVSGATATVNLFSGWKMSPKRGNCLKIQTLLLHLCDGDEDLMTWVLRWLAYPLRNRGAKMETSIIMHGDEGSGKNFFFEKVIKKIYGEYGYVIGNAQLESQFNDWASMKLFMVADEVVTRSELKHMKGKLKYLVSGDSIIINPKGLPEHSEANHMNFVFLSNELQPLALDKTDRRYLVIWTPPALPREFYVEVAQEIEAGGIEAFYHYLVHELDMGDFDEHTKPIYTDAKDSLIEKSLTPAERFYRDWSRGFLPLPFISCGATQLYDAYKVWCEKSGEPRYISQTLFSPTVARYAGDSLEKRVIKYEYGQVVKQRHVFLTGNKPEGKTLSDWVADASALFEESLKAYRSRAGANVDS